MLSQKLEKAVRKHVETLVSRTLTSAWISADAITLTSLLLMISVVALLAQGALGWAGLVFIVASSLDMLDGALARSRHEVSRFGAFLDSTIDRYSEFLLFLGLLLYYYLYRAESSLLYMGAIYIAAQGSLLTSYIRARAESLGYDGRGGLFERPERVILISLGLLTPWITPCLVILAVVSHVTALQRFYNVFSQSRAERSS
jgi:CDP-diacylglycerol--glycerol-3-phosphate 3-phosphatidyltransferase